MSCGLGVCAPWQCHSARLGWDGCSATSHLVHLLCSRYFQCPPKFGLFAPIHKVIRIGFPSTSPAKAKKSKRMAMGVSALTHSPSSSSISSVSSVASSVGGRPSRSGLVSSSCSLNLPLWPSFTKWEGWGFLAVQLLLHHSWGEGNGVWDGVTHLRDFLPPWTQLQVMDTEHLWPLKSLNWVCSGINLSSAVKSRFIRDPCRKRTLFPVSHGHAAPLTSCAKLLLWLSHCGGWQCPGSHAWGFGRCSSRQKAEQWYY